LQQLETLKFVKEKAPVTRKQTANIKGIEYLEA